MRDVERTRAPDPNVHTGPVPWEADFELHIVDLWRRLLRTMCQEGCRRVEESKIQQRKTCICDSVARGGRSGRRRQLWIWD